MTSSGFAAWRRWITPTQAELRVCLESTGPYWRPLAAWLEKHEIPYALANPRKVRRFAQASEHRSKTDPIDAEILLRFAETFQLLPTSPLDPAYRQLRAVSRRILQLQLQLDTERDRADKAAVDPATPTSVRDSCRHIQQTLQQTLDQLEDEAGRLIGAHPRMCQQWKLLLSITSIGPKTARTLIAEYADLLGVASPRQMTRYAGLDIVLHESGNSVRKHPRISKQGNWRLRRALYLACLSGIVHNPTLHSFYQRKLHAGIPKKQALVATMRKLIHLCFGVLNNQTPFHSQTQMT
jgi:transposase